MRKNFVVAAGILFAFVGIILLLVLFFLSGKGDNSIRTTGIVEGIEVNLSPKVAGQIINICCKESDNISQGQVAFQLDSGELRAAVDQALADVRSSKVAMEEAQREMGRSDTLYADNYISKEARDQAETAYQVSAANYRAAIARLDSARATLADTIVKSPISGTVVYKELEQGETVSPGMTVMTVIDLNNLYIRADIDESRISSVVLYSPAIITTEDTPPKVFKGTVAEIGRYAEFATLRDVGRGRQDIKTFRVKITVENPEKILKPGMTVEVKIQKKESQNGKQ